MQVPDKHKAPDPFALMDRVAKDLDVLKTKYDQYFQGLEKREPFALRQKMDKDIRTVAELQMQNAKIKFKAQQLISKFNTYKKLWERNLREIEEGVHKRDKFLHQIKTNPEHQIQKETPKKQSKKPDAAQLLFDQYVAAKKSCSEDTKGISFEGFKNNLKKHQKTLMEKSPGKKIAFKVVKENGKAKLKAVIKN